MTKTKKDSTSNLVEGLTLIESALTAITQIVNENDRAVASLAAGFFYKASSILGKDALTLQEANLVEYAKSYPQATMFLEAVCSLVNSSMYKEIVGKPKK
jgi:hypothetical protein